MRTRDIITGLLVVAIVVGGVLWAKKVRLQNQAQVSPQTPTIEEKIGTVFPGFQVPDDIEKVELKDISGGDSFGVATRTEVLANLPDPEAGKHYQVWLEKGNQKILLGSMRVAKGGYLLEYKSSDYPGYNKVVVKLGDKSILEGSF